MTTVTQAVTSSPGGLMGKKRQKVQWFPVESLQQWTDQDDNQVKIIANFIKYFPRDSKVLKITTASTTKSQFITAISWGVERQK